MSWDKLYSIQKKIDYVIKKNDNEYCVIPSCYKTCACMIFLLIITDREKFKIFENGIEIEPEEEIGITSTNSLNFKKFIYGNRVLLTVFLKSMFFYGLFDVKVQRDYFVNMFEKEDDLDSIWDIKANVKRKQNGMITIEDTNYPLFDISDRFSKSPIVKRYWDKNKKKYISKDEFYQNKKGEVK